MEINLKEKLRSLRQQKNVTQEALANHLGITPQSVGKWERGEGYPDITLLPKIAFYFDVTVDELLCVDQVRIDEAINEYKRQAEACLRDGDIDQFLTIWEKAYAEFPNDLRVMHGLMYALNAREETPCPAEKAKRIIKLGETLLEKSTDANQRDGALQRLCFTYQGIDDEKALQYANMGGHFDMTGDHLRAYIQNGEEGVKACQEYIQTLIHTAAIVAANMVTKCDFSVHDRIEARAFAIDILKRLHSEEDAAFCAFDLSLNYSWLAWEYAALNDKTSTLKNLEECRKYAIIEANTKDWKGKTLFGNRLECHRGNLCKNYKGNSCNIALRGLKDSVFDFVRNEETFKRIVADLEKYAEPIS